MHRSVIDSACCACASLVDQLLYLMQRVTNDELTRTVRAIAQGAIDGDRAATRRLLWTTRHVACAARLTLGSCSGQSDDGGLAHSTSGGDFLHASGYARLELLATLVAFKSCPKR